MAALHTGTSMRPHFARAAAKVPRRTGTKSPVRGSSGRLALVGTGLLRGRNGYEIGEPVIDAGILGPDRRIESGRETGLQLRRRQAGDAGDIAPARPLVGTARRRVPVIIGGVI